PMKSAMPMKSKKRVKDAFFSYAVVDHWPEHM
ncbi:hypothetical protein AAULR_13794, partial [Lacticaseibacillus rhamnosus MTCC 5462]